MYTKNISPSGQVIIALDQDGERISFSENIENVDYQKYLAWLEEGNEPEIAEL